jgi:hypothetical protein
MDLLNQNVSAANRRTCVAANCVDSYSYHQCRHGEQQTPRSRQFREYVLRLPAKSASDKRRYTVKHELDDEGYELLNGKK